MTRGAVLAHGANDARDRAATLARLVAQELIPRLRLAHPPHRDRYEPTDQEIATGERVTGASVAEMVALALAHDAAGMIACADRILACGICFDSLLLKVLAPAAERVETLCNAHGEDWVAAMLAEWHLKRLLRHLLARFDTHTVTPVSAPRALLTTLPGEQERLEMLIAAAFLRRQGWQVNDEPAATRLALTQRVHGEWFSIVGLSIASEARFEAMARGIRAVRRASLNPALGVLVLGPTFTQHPEMVHLVGADAAALDAREAARQARDLCSWLVFRT
ncbi:MAG: cobalamin-dependent protein [Acidibrevibacterium sp.]|uniref:cobalamin-dependent protein n=1 Tax=Acidibrevibacterium sp. TaxID=2606776 RepID=UPI003D004B3D